MNANVILNRSILTLLALLFVLPATQTAQAQPMIEHVPDNAAIYIGWRGSEDMGPAYEGSNLQGIIEKTGLLAAVPQLVQTLQQIADQAPGGGDVQAGKLVGMAGTLYAQMWSNGGAMYMLPPVENGPPIPRLAIIWNKAKGNKQLTDTLKNVVELVNGMEQVPLFLSEAGDAMVLAVGFQAGELEFESLGKAERYKSASKQVHPDGALVVYVDVQQWIKQVDQAAKMMQRQAAEWGDKDPFAEVWGKLRDVSGLTGAKRLMMSAGIKDKNWQTQLFLDAPAPRKGLLALIDNKPIATDNLLHVPKTATYLQVFSMDAPKVMDTVREMMGTVDPNMVKQMNQGLAEANKEVGFNIEKELVKGMGPVWSVYIDPMIAGNSFSSVVLVNQLRDAKAVKEALAKLTTSANEALADATDDGPVKVRFLTQEISGQTITHFGIPYVAPAWMVKGDRLYISLYPQGLEMAADHSGKKADSILVNSAFTKSIAKFGGKPYTGVSFVDLPETTPDGYGFNMMLIQSLAGAGEMFSGKPSAMRMPPVGKILPFIEPSASMTWVDRQGLHMQAIEPFPGSSLLGPAKGFESVMAVSGPLAVGVMLPALGSAREAARQTHTLSQGRQIAMASMSYAFDHEEVFSEDIAQLLPYTVEGDTFIAANSTRVQALAVGFEDWKKEKKEAYLRANSSFVIVPLGKINEIEEPSNKIMVFQRPDDAGDSPLVVAWADGHATVEKDHEKVAAQIKAQTGKTIDELIKRQEKFGQ